MHPVVPRSRRGERGSAALELAILGPVVLLLTFAIVQAGLTAYARSLALAAAREGVTAARAYQATSVAGLDRAREFLATHAGDSLIEASVNDRGSTTTTVRIEVTGRALAVLPGLPPITIRQHAQAERERYVPETTP
ncbi:MAG: hypothetical protein QG597_4160 [Actinomycetota bacterium]|nr:hypothetical protein [Actinomycetota bacterium]